MIQLARQLELQRNEMLEKATREKIAAGVQPLVLRSYTSTGMVQTAEFSDGTALQIRTVLENQEVRVVGQWMSRSDPRVEKPEP